MNLSQKFIHCKTPLEFERAQLLSFKNGYLWNGDNKILLSFSLEEYPINLHIDVNSISYGLNNYIDHSFKEYYMERGSIGDDRLTEGIQL